MEYSEYKYLISEINNMQSPLITKSCLYDIKKNRTLLFAKKEIDNSIFILHTYLFEKNIYTTLYDEEERHISLIGVTNNKDFYIDQNGIKYTIYADKSEYLFLSLLIEREKAELDIDFDKRTKKVSYYGRLHPHHCYVPQY